LCCIQNVQHSFAGFAVDGSALSGYTVQFRDVVVEVFDCNFLGPDIEAFLVAASAVPILFVVDELPKFVPDADCVSPHPFEFFRGVHFRPSQASQVVRVRNHNE
jgi:hypothetical protein